MANKSTTSTTIRIDLTDLDRLRIDGAKRRLSPGRFLRRLLRQRPYRAALAEVDRVRKGKRNAEKRG